MKMQRRERRIARSLAVSALAVVAVACSTSDGAAEPGAEPGSTPTATDVAGGDVFTEAGAVSQGEGESSSPQNGDGAAPAPTTTLVPEIEQVPADEVEVVGTPPPTFVYTEEVPPAESVVATLCNLEGDFIRTLRTEDDAGRPVVDDDLRLSILSLRDSVSLWRDLELSFPDTGGDVDLADEIAATWNQALSADAEGDEAEATALMAQAEELIDQLPDEASADTCQA
ncbi:MAG: hypothetical protein AB8G26_07615 [Ilumatobacter sp.]